MYYIACDYCLDHYKTWVLVSNIGIEFKPFMQKVFKKLIHCRPLAPNWERYHLLWVYKYGIVLVTCFREISNVPVFSPRIYMGGLHAVETDLHLPGILFLLWTNKESLLVFLSCFWPNVLLGFCVYMNLHVFLETSPVFLEQLCKIQQGFFSNIEIFVVQKLNKFLYLPLPKHFSNHMWS